jgi:eukaryotic-like serine/threonine-protein kinase
VIEQTQHWTPPAAEQTRLRVPSTRLFEDRVLSGRYRLDGLLGRGGMSEVYLAQDTVLGRPVAVKVFRPGTGSLRHGKRQQLEAELLASLDHPGLVTVYDAGFDPDEERSFLVMEIVRGPTLAARLAARPLTEAEVRDVGAPLADALAYVHDRGVVHRDVKPGNVLFTDAGDHHGVKLTDFGIARMADSARLTEDGLIVGSARYLSPEQARGAEVGPPTDVYALGLLLLECLTGTPVFPGTGIETAVARLHRDPQIPDRVDPAFGRLLAAMTRREPAERPSAQDVAAALRHASATQDLPAIEAQDHHDGPAVRGGSVPRWAWVVATCAALIVALTASAALLGHAPPRNESATGVRPPAASSDAAQSPPVAPVTAPSAQSQPALQSDAPPEQTGGTADAGAQTDDASDANGDGKEKGKGKGNKGKKD